MKVKICGITHLEDAEYAAGSGADYIGMVFAERSRRKVPLPLAKNIAHAAKNAGAEPIGIFLDQSADQIISICEQTDIHTVQLHGTVAHQALPVLLGKYSILYVISVEKNGVFSHTEALPHSVVPLYDNLVGGSGTTFDWKVFSPLKHPFWMLAGGLNPSNVKEAIALFQPNGVDVATGVEFPETRRKNPALVKAFIEAAKNVRETK